MASKKRDAEVGYDHSQDPQSFPRHQVVKHYDHVTSYHGNFGRASDLSFNHGAGYMQSEVFTN